MRKLGVIPCLERVQYNGETYVVKEKVCYRTVVVYSLAKDIASRWDHRVNEEELLKQNPIWNDQNQSQI